MRQSFVCEPHIATKTVLKCFHLAGAWMMARASPITFGQSRRSSTYCAKLRLSIPLLVHTLNPTVRHKKKKTKKQIRIQDLKPRKDAKGGMAQGAPQDPKWILKHLQLGFR